MAMNGISSNPTNPSQSDAAAVRPDDAKKAQSTASTAPVEAPQAPVETQAPETSTPSSESSDTLEGFAKLFGDDGTPTLQTQTANVTPDLATSLAQAQDNAVDPFAAIERELNFSFDQLVADAQKGLPGAKEQLAQMTERMRAMAQPIIVECESDQYSGAQDKKEVAKEQQKLTERALAQRDNLKTCADRLRAASDKVPGKQFRSAFVAASNSLYGDVNKLRAFLNRQANQVAAGAKEELAKVLQAPKAAVGKEVPALKNPKLPALKIAADGLVKTKEGLTNPATAKAKAEAKQAEKLAQAKTESSPDAEQVQSGEEGEQAVAEKEAAPEPATPEQLKLAEKAVATLVPAEVRAERLKAHKERQAKINSCRSALASASEEMECLEGNGAAALFEGAKQVFGKVQQATRQLWERDFKDMMDGTTLIENTVQGLVFCDKQVRDLVEAGKTVTQAVEGAAATASEKVARILSAKPGSEEFLANANNLIGVLKHRAEKFSSDLDRASPFGYAMHQRDPNDLRGADFVSREARIV